MKENVKETLEYIKAGNIGCTFATHAAKFLLQGKDIGWEFHEVNTMVDKLLCGTKHRKPQK